MTCMPDPRERPWLTVAELADITGEGQKALRAAIDAGQIPSVRVGRYVRIPTARLMNEVLGLATNGGGPDEAA
jgi:excisionase family DNA binding protein